MTACFLPFLFFLEIKDTSISLQLQFLFLYCLYHTLKVCLQYYHKGSLNRKKEEMVFFFPSACDSTELNFFKHGQTKPRNHFNDIQNHYSVQQQQQQQKPHWFQVTPNTLHTCSHIPTHQDTLSLLSWTLTARATL